MKQKMKLCIDCKHAIKLGPAEALPKCNHPNNIFTSLVDGTTERVHSCSTLRSSNHRCGPFAKWYQSGSERLPVPPLWQRWLWEFVEF